MPVKGRFAVAGLGVLMLASSFHSLDKGRLAWVNVHGELFWAGGGVAIGVVLIMVSLVPASWIEKAGALIATFRRARRGPAEIR